MNGHASARQGAALVAAAATLAGSPFRLHGRDPATGLDCVGLVVAALSATGATPRAPKGYGLRNLSVDHWLHFADRSGLTASPGPILADDVLLIALSHCQHHLAIAASAASIIHAHAGLRQVVRQPLDPAWRLHIKWHLAQQMEG
ncbi:MAG: hypothetical protein CVT75_09575 [Alphaproteobacteria bacterium HGW-Alphaproteobacteria-14]|nr:MAG: hypothetical protein CVT75_09575 [Alphaproteobacteria bacterium HGW-Alphaproteobacteria-14]